VRRVGVGGALYNVVANGMVKEKARACVGREKKCGTVWLVGLPRGTSPREQRPLTFTTFYT